MNVREPGRRPRRPAPPRRQAGPRRSAAGRILPLAAAAIVVAGFVLVFGGGLTGGGGSPSPPVAARATAAASGPAAVLGTPTPATTPTARPTPAPPPPVTPAPTQAAPDVAFVPVASFRSPLDAIGWTEVRALPEATSSFGALVLVEQDADGILETLRLDRAALGPRLVTVEDGDALAADLIAHGDRLGFLRADEVGPSIRALGWGATDLFGVHKVETLADWPLVAPLAAAPTGGSKDPAYDPAASWTLIAGGDILLDRGVALAIQKSTLGASFPFAGGTVDITGRCRDCSVFGWDLPYTRRTGNEGALVADLRAADLAIANFENPAPDRFRFHASGTVFSANPAYIEGLEDAGIDWVSLANNHIGDAGRNGILQTMANLDRYGILHGGAGKNTAQARAPSLIDVGGVSVAILGYDTIAPSYGAGASTPGSAQMTAAAVKADVAAARKAGADVVIVFPHWGVEYRATPSASQRRLGRAAIDAGADMVIGNHAHWAAAVETYKGKPIWYALGNLVFDQTWSEPTMEGITLELTFTDSTLVQARMRPHLILDKAQPNFLDPAGDGQVVLRQVFGASKGLLDW